VLIDMDSFFVVQRTNTFVNYRCGNAHALIHTSLGLSFAKCAT